MYSVFWFSSFSELQYRRGMPEQADHTGLNCSCKVFLVLSQLEQTINYMLHVPAATNVLGLVTILMLLQYKVINFLQVPS